VTTAYHVPCEKTKKQVEDILATLGTSKPIHVRPFWVNEALWSRGDKSATRDELKLPQNAFFVGSFQRDTEGSDLVTPKLEKGPDRFCDAVELMHKEGMEPIPLLAGWRRQYVLNRLNNASIPFVYKELPNFPTVKKLYSALDLYVVGSRFEGGPQAIFECASMDVPIVSTDVGAASEILHPSSIFDPDDPKSFLDAMMSARSSESRDYALEKVKQHHRLPAYTFFRELLNSI
jgi:glycosyltransferase involved in cell wall biosynthesis